MRHRYSHHFEDELSYYLDQAVRSAQVLRFAEGYCHDEKDIYTTSTLEAQEHSV